MSGRRRAPVVSSSCWSASGSYSCACAREPSHPSCAPPGRARGRSGSLLAALHLPAAAGLPRRRVPLSPPVHGALDALARRLPVLATARLTRGPLLSRHTTSISSNRFRQRPVRSEHLPALFPQDGQALGPESDQRLEPSLHADLRPSGGGLFSLTTVIVPVLSWTWYAPATSAPADFFTSPLTRTVLPLYWDGLLEQVPDRCGGSTPGEENERAGEGRDRRRPAHGMDGHGCLAPHRGLW